MQNKEGMITIRSNKNEDEWNSYKIFSTEEWLNNRINTEQDKSYSQYKNF
jgi:hypothetical protein